MILCGSLPLASARLAARHGRRLDAAAWHRIEVLRDFGAALEEARHSALRPWLLGLTPESTPAEVEAALRAQARASVAEVAAWVGEDWQAAVQWCAVLPDLAPLQHLLRGGPPPAWMAADARWQPLLEALPATPGAPLPAVPPWRALAGARPETLGAAWCEAWQALWPRPWAGTHDDTLQRLAALLRQHAGAFAVAGPGSGPARRAALRERLVAVLRQAALAPAGVFAQLALTALDFERLRGELLRRVWFPQGHALPVATGGSGGST